MKKIIYAAMLLLGLGIMTTSCSKDSTSSSSSIIGKWKIQKIEVIDGTDTQVFTQINQKYGNIELGKYEYPVLGAQWANGNLTFNENTMTCCLGTSEFEIKNNILYLGGSNGWDATILSIQNNQLILSTQYNNINNFLYKYYYSK